MLHSGCCVAAAWSFEVMLHGCSMSKCYVFLVILNILTHFFQSKFHIFGREEDFSNCGMWIATIHDSGCAKEFYWIKRKDLNKKNPKFCTSYKTFYYLSYDDNQLCMVFMLGCSWWRENQFEGSLFWIGWKSCWCLTVSIWFQSIFTYPVHTWACR
jgi:hypothetical protein